MSELTFSKSIYIASSLQTVSLITFYKAQFNLQEFKTVGVMSSGGNKFLTSENKSKAPVDIFIAEMKLRLNNLSSSQESLLSEGDKLRNTHGYNQR